MLNYVFDFDGTLITELKLDYVELKIKLKEILKFNGELSPMIDKIYSLSNGDFEIINNCFKLIDNYEEKALENIKIKEDNIKLYLESKHKIIVSRNGFNVIDKFFKKNNIVYPDLICCRDNCKKLKPNIEHIQMIFNKFKELNNDNICIVGDSWHDKELSENIKCKFLQI